MFEMNGRYQSPQRIPKRANWSSAGRVVLMRLLEVPLPVRLACWLTLLVLTGLLAGCAGLSTPPSETPRNPSLPPPQQSQPTEPYLSRVLRNIALWDKKLRDTLPTP